MTNDGLSRQLALNPTQSFIVQAPAGSGKTQLLVERYLTLLCQVTNPEEIVAITFTRKAAHEMRSRILDMLNHRENPLIQKVLSRDHQLGWRLPELPERLRIQTIDSLNRYLVNQAPLTSGINLKHSVSQEPETGLYYLEAARATLNHLEDVDSPAASALATILLHLHNDWHWWENLAVNMLRKREQWLPHLTGLNQLPQLRQQLELELQIISQEFSERGRQLFPLREYRLLCDILTQLRQINHLHPAGDTLKLPQIAAEITQLSLQDWKNIAELLLNQSGNWRQKFTQNQGFLPLTSWKSSEHREQARAIKAQMSELLERLASAEELRVGLQELKNAPPTEYSDQQWQIIEVLLTLLPLLAAHLKVVFKEHRTLDHAEIAMAALRVLGDSNTPSDLALNLDYRIQHLLVDEFQDTSLANYQLLERLTAGWQPHDGHTLFLVGDPMQSIYRFREAEVGLFLRVQREGIGDLPLTPITLHNNFRSTQGIVEWINSNFSRILPHIADINYGGVPFNPAVATRTAPYPATVKVTCLSGPAAESDNSDNLANPETPFIINLIEQLLHQHPGETIAILARSRSHLIPITLALKLRGLEYQAHELEPLYPQLIIRDLFSLTRALYDPTDRLAWFAILRAPWCGLTLRDLDQIAQTNNPIIWDELKKIASPLPSPQPPTTDRTMEDLRMENISSDGAIRLIKLVNQLSPLMPLRWRIGWSTLVRQAWLALGGPATAHDEAELSYAEQYFSCLGKQELDLELLQRQLYTCYSTVKTNPATIQIMTIHKAKGLEFDHVIIPQIQHAVRNDERQILLWWERPHLHQGSGLLLAPLMPNSDDEDSIYRYLRTVENKRRYYETGRLLYVAMTRARNSVTLTGSLPAATKLEGNFSGTFLEQLQPVWQDSWFLPTPISDPTIKQAGTISPNPPPIIRFPTAWDPPVRSPQSLEILASCTRDELAESTSDRHELDNRTDNHPENLNPTLINWNSDQAAIFGTVMHACLAQFSQLWRDDQTFSAYQPLWIKLLRQAGYPSVTQGLQMIAQILGKMLQDPRGKWILQPHQAATNELAVTVHQNGKYQNYVIDRTFIDELGIRWIIDYKIIFPQLSEITAKPSRNEYSESPLSAPELSAIQLQYRNQLCRYLQAYRQLEPQRIIRAGIYLPVSSDWIEILSN